MKLSELLSNLNSPHEPFYDTEDFMEELDLPEWVNLEDNGFTERVVTAWVCTDTFVGTRAIYRDGKLICISHQPYRKSDREFKWVSKEIYEETKEFVRSLIEETEFSPAIQLIDFEEEQDIYYTLEYTDQILPQFHEFAIYKNQKVRLDLDSCKFNYNYSEPQQLWIFIGQEDTKPVKVLLEDLKFFVPIAS